jgi:hypothetical protein
MYDLYKSASVKAGGCLDLVTPPPATTGSNYLREPSAQLARFALSNAFTWSRTASADRQERPKIALVRSDNPTALVRHVRDLIKVAADGAEFRDGVLECQQLVARKRRQVSQMRAGED